MSTQSLGTDHGKGCSHAELTPRLHSAYSVSEEDDIHDEILPLSLRSLSLLTVINDLDSYSIELLASLPLWLRYQLLNCLPVFDLCRLDHTPVARGVNVDEIWKSRRVPSTFRYNALKHINCMPFRGCLSENSITWPADIPDLDPELEAALQKVPCMLKDILTHCDDSVTHQLDETLQLANDAREAYLLKVAFGVLDILDPNVSPKIVGDWLISIKGDLLMKHLTTNQSQTDSTQLEEDHQYQLWNTQGNALATYQDARGEIRLAPYRLLPIRDIKDPLKMFSILIHNCGLQPSALTFDRRMFANEHYMEMSFQNKEKFNPLFQNFLCKVSVLGLVNNAGIGLRQCKFIIEGVVGDGENCQLRVLYCSLPQNDNKNFMKCLSPSLLSIPGNHDPPRYQGLCALDLDGLCFASVPYLTTLLQQQPLLKIVHIVQHEDTTSPLHSNHPDSLKFFSVLGSLFSRTQFQQLSIMLTMSIHPLALIELLKGFILAPCSHLQQLQLTTSHIPESSELPEKSISEVASANMSGTKFLDCGIRHKILVCNTDYLLHHLLSLPTIRLREIGLECTEYGHGNNYLHLSTLHPDLRVSRLQLKFSDNATLRNTIHDDFRILLKIPTLEELSVLGCWLMSQEAMAALTQGLKEQSKVGSIHRITLCSHDDLSDSQAQELSLIHI